MEFENRFLIADK